MVSDVLDSQTAVAFAEKIDYRLPASLPVLNYSRQLSYYPERTHWHLAGSQARPGDGVPREALPTMVNLKKSQLKGAAEKLRERAKRLRETTEVQRVFQQGVLHLRKSWRIIAPNHGKVCVTS